MFRKTLFVTAAMFATTASSYASIIISANSINTPGVAGYKTYTLTATSTDPNQQIVGFDFASQASYGFAAVGGSFNQVNPFGLPTIFNDNNSVIVGTGG